MNKIDKAVFRKKPVPTKNSKAESLPFILPPTIPKTNPKTPIPSTLCNSYQVLPTMSKFPPKDSDSKTRSKSIKNYQKLTNLGTLYTTFSSSLSSNQIQYSKDQTPRKRSSSEKRPPYSKAPSKLEFFTKEPTKLSNYLSLDDFRPTYQETSPRVLFEVMSQQNTQVKGLSKWFFGDGTYEWRECVIKKYDQEKELFSILWPNGKTKQVSKINLRFESEDEATQEKNIEKARKNRLELEISLRYDAFLGVPDESYPVFTTIFIQKIVEFMQGYPRNIACYLDAEKIALMTIGQKFDLTRHLWKNEKTHMVDESLISHKLRFPSTYHFIKSFISNLAEFELFSPKSEKKIIASTSQLKSMFEELIIYWFYVQKDEEFCTLNKDALAETVFQVKLQDRLKVYKDSLSFSPHINDPTRFEASFKSFKENSILDKKESIALLQKLQKVCLSIKPFIFNASRFELTDLSNFIGILFSESLAFFDDLKNQVLEVHCSLLSILNHEDFKRIQRNELKVKEKCYSSQKVELEDKLSGEVLGSIMKLLKVCNMRLEDKIRSSFIASLKSLHNKIKPCSRLNGPNLKIFRSSTLGDFSRFKRLNSISDSDSTINAYSQATRLMRLDLQINWKEKKIEIFPTKSSFFSSIFGFIERNNESLSQVKCLETFQTGPARCSGFMEILGINSKILKKYSKKIEVGLDFQFKLIEILLNKLDPFLYILSLDRQGLENSFSQSTPLEVEQEISRLNSDVFKVKEMFFPSKMVFGMWVVYGNLVRDEMMKRLKRAIEVLTKILLNLIEEKVGELDKRFCKVFGAIDLVPSTLEELNEVRSFIKLHFMTEVTFFDVETRAMFVNVLYLERNFYMIPQDLYNRCWNCVGYIKRLVLAKSKSLYRIATLIESFTSEVAIRRESLHEEIKVMYSRYQQLIKEENIENYEKMAEDFKILKDSIESASKETKLINSREVILEVDVTNFKLLDKMQRKFTPYCKIWHFIRDFMLNYPFWMRDPIFYLKVDQIVMEINLYLTEINRMEKGQFRENPSSLKITKDFSAKVKEFEQFLSLIRVFTNPGMKERHWAEINSKIGWRPSVEKSETLRILIEKNIMQHSEILELVNEQATKELALDNARRNMETSWNSVEFRFEEFKDCQIIDNFNELLDLIDDQLTKTEIMLASPNIKFIHAEVVKWKQNMKKMQDIIENWKNLQSSWLYLHPIFMSDDISLQIPAASQQFELIESQWLGLIHASGENGFVYDFCMNKPRFLQYLQETNKNLEKIIKSLNEYLLHKRKAFSRFYFLSNDELVSLLSCSQDFKSIQRYIIKCFEAISSVGVDENWAVSMISPEGEKVTFQEKIDLNRCGKNVEVWLNDIEIQMKSTLKSILTNASIFDQENLRSFVLSFPSQIVHTTRHLTWTKTTESIIKSRSLLSHQIQTNSKYLDLIEIVRSNLSTNERITFGTMVVLDIHSKDILQELIKSKVSSVSDFSWLRCLRIYESSNQETVQVKMLDCIRDYGFEYLGNLTRLVSTKLTDRCFLTLMCALHLNLGGAPEGPAGTGKTETIKDLAKSIGMKCVVFNCSDSLDHLYMAKFFTGLCFCGAWACFDEFNRIETEVLSVVAQQILHIQLAVQKKATKFNLDNDEVKMDLNVAVFITMNPSYASRSKLPDNLKALLRSVTMITPEYSLIAQIYLFSFGFRDAENLAKKVVNCLHIASLQLSGQSHYDYGLRAVATIVKAAGWVKQVEHGNQREDFESEESIIIRAIKVTNIPKFVIEDIQLFHNILHDHFGNSNQSKPLNDNLCILIKKALNVLNLEKTPEFESKIIEIYQTLTLRHGLMIVGPTLSGKSTALKVLSLALSFEKTSEMSVVNPKALTSEQFFGYFDHVAHEWVDGQLSSHMRKYCESDEDGYKWVVLDSPVDSGWIESMNTVMDDNKKLCLSSGDIIKLSPSVRVIIEVDHLNNATPATVSRCGIVYMKDTLSPDCIFKAWVKDPPLKMNTSEHKFLYSQLFNDFLVPSLDFFSKFTGKKSSSLIQTCKVTVLLFESLIIRKGFSRKEHDDAVKEEEKQMKEDMESISVNKFKGMLVKNRLVTQTTLDIVEKKVMTEEEMLKEQSRISNWFLFALFWGVSLSESENFRNELFHFIKGFNIRNTLIPEDLPNLFYDPKENKWLSFETQINASPSSPPTTRLVYTSSLLAYSFLLLQLIPRKQNILISGATGTGKSFLISQVLSTLDKSFVVAATLMTGRSDATEVQKFIEAEVTRRRKGVFGPDISKFQVFFIDDLSLPLKDQFGVQGAVEMLRSLIERKQIIDKLTHLSAALEDFQLVTCLTRTSQVTPRFPSKFIEIHFDEHDSNSLTIIAKTLLTSAMINHQFFIQQAIPRVSEGIVKVYLQVRSKLPPTPLKSHYLFNFRDLFSVIQGISACGALKLETLETLYKLWTHECTRVFCDRLVDDNDKSIVKSILKEVFDKTFTEKWEKIMGEEPIFVNFLDDRMYEECQSAVKARKTLEKFLEEYNYVNNIKLNLLLFNYAVEHICRISRVLVWSRGHLLLIGIAGSGRLSLTKLSVFFLKMSIYQIKLTKTYGINEWSEDLKNILKETGQESKKLVFVLRDNEIIMEHFLDGINHLLNSGQVPNLFSLDEKKAIINYLKTGFLLKNKDEIWQIFIENIRANLHIVLCMTPKGDSLRLRLQQFPSIGNCCFIDWFDEWPEEALLKVADYYLSDEADIQDRNLVSNLRKLFVDFHLASRKLAITYKQERKRVVFVTPAQYLLFMRNFTEIFKSKSEFIRKMEQKYSDGVKYLESTQKLVILMQENLKLLKEDLEKKTQEVEELLQIVTKEQQDADNQRFLVVQDSRFCQEQAVFARKTREQCEEALSQVLPELDLALRSLETIKKQDLNILKSMINPPDAVRLTLEAIAMFYNQPATKVKDPSNPSQFISDFFETGRRTVSMPKFIKNLQNFDKDNTPEDAINRIAPYMDMEMFNPEIVKHASSAAEGVCRWLRAIFHYYFIFNDVRPKKLALEKAEKELRDREEHLIQKKNELKGVDKYIKILQGRYASQLAEKRRLIMEISGIELKLKRAVKLLELLLSEKEAWNEKIVGYTSQYKNLVGDVLLASASVSYLGPFDIDYRKIVINLSWMDVLKNFPGVFYSDNFSLINTIGNQQVIQSWILCGLPSDTISIENALIVHRSCNWPLIIDPQGQALKWLKTSLSKEKSSKYFSSKLESLDFMSTLENALLVGASLVIFDIKESIDPVLDSLLLKEWYVRKASTYIKIGDLLKEVVLTFKLFMVSCYPNPNFSPEIQTKVTLLNFTITEEGLSEQLLHIVCRKEMFKETNERDLLIMQSLEYKKKLTDFEDKMLEMLQSNRSILDNEDMIVSLNEIKKMAVEVVQKLEVAKRAEQKIFTLQKKYEPIAKKTTVLYFCIAELPNIQHMYQFSITWFISIYIKGIEQAENSTKFHERLKNIVKKCRELIFRSTCKTLYEEDRHIFAFLICIKLQMISSNIQAWQWKFLVSGLVDISQIQEKSLPFLSDHSWRQVSQLDLKLPGLVEHLSKNHLKWENFLKKEKVFQNVPSFEELVIDLPEPFSKTSSIIKLLIAKALKPELLSLMIKSYIKSHLGEKFLSPQVFSYPELVKETTCIQPMLCILNPGAEVREKIVNLANDREVKLLMVSMGKGQNVKAEAFIKEATVQGYWVFLENCHLAVSWLPALDLIMENIQLLQESRELSPKFKLFLTSAPISSFPISILMTCVKFNTELPSDLNSNLLAIYKGLAENHHDSQFYEVDNNGKIWKKLFFQLCLFHCVIVQRNAYGSIGWNNVYEFTDGDLKVSAKQLMGMVCKYEVIDFDALNYLIAECHYGGKITDNFDKRTIQVMLSKFMTSSILNDSNYNPIPVDGFSYPDIDDLSEMVEHLKSFPSAHSSLIYGLHPTSEISRSLKTSSRQSSKLLNLDSKSVSSSFESEKSSLFSILKLIQSKINNYFNVSSVRSSYPYNFEDPINEFLIQELEKFNNLSKYINSTLTEITKVYEGLIVMNDEHEKFSRSLLNNQLPEKWLKVSYLTCKSLISFFEDFEKRVDFYRTWVEEGRPETFWISAFYSAQAFLTALVQEYSRKKDVRSDDLVIDSFVDDGKRTGVGEVRVFGLYLEGASWNEGKLDEMSHFGVFSVFPKVILKACTQGDRDSRNLFECPVYRTQVRAGNVSTTGHSTNYLISVNLPCMLTSNHWILRGTALFCQIE